MALSISNGITAISDGYINVSIWKEKEYSLLLFDSKF